MTEVMIKNFRPASTQGQVINGGPARGDYSTTAVTTGAGVSSAATSFLPTTEVSGRTRARSVMVVNPTTNIVFVEFGDNGVVALTPSGATKGSTPVLPGSGKLFEAIDAAFVAVIAAAVSTVYVTPGEGT